jgi:tripartite-type tricarboxylate transporter receptor subunit TctC
MTDRRTFIAAGAAFTASAALPARAQAFPDRPVRLVQGFAPGGNADTIARLVGAEMQKGLGQPIVVETMAGAGGAIASAAVARAKPDGHTLLLATGGHVVAAAMMEKPSYRAAADFEAISTVTFFPFLVVVPTDSKFASLAAVLAAARAAPGTIAFGSAGVGSTHHLAGELLARTAAAPLLHVPYKGDSASLTGLMSGDVPMVITPPTAALAQIKAGRMRAIATTGPQRWPGLPEVPTVAEQGVAGFDVRSWAGLLAPAGTPRPIVERLNAEVLKALQDPGVRQKLVDIGGEARGLSPDEMKAMLVAESDRWTRLVAEAGIPRQ